MDESFYQEQNAKFRHEQQWRETRAVPKHIADFSSNDYLGLSTHPALVQSAIEASKTFGIGSTGSRLISGTSEAVIELENTIAQWKGTEAALVFNSGYQANVAILQAVLESGDFVAFDRLNHASLIDGVRLSNAKWRRYKHLDLGDLERALTKAPNDSKRWIVTDSLFSMDGDYPDLQRLVKIAKQNNACILIDEAHASGVFGKTKRSGLCEELEVSRDITLQMGTFSKALGGFGAYVAGSRTMIDFLVNKARGFIYSTALPPAAVAAAQAAIQLIQKDGTATEQLWKNTHLAWSELKQTGLITEEKCYSQIIPIPLESSEEAVRLSQALWDKGYFVQAIRPPTVPANTALLRLSISAKHTEKEIIGLTKTLAALLPTTVLAAGE